jgi:hypothetical protein
MWLKTGASIVNVVINLLNKGVMCNLNHKPKHWVKTFALESDSTSSHSPLLRQDYFRLQLAKNIEDLYKRQKRRRHHSSNRRYQKNCICYKRTIKNKRQLSL